MILRELAARNREGARLADLVTSLDLEQPTVHRMLKSLVAESLVMQDPESKRYFLGQAVYELGLAASQRFDLRSLCEPVLASLAEKSGDTAFLTVRSGDEAVCLDRREGDSPIQIFTLAVGDRRPLGVGAGSMALLAAFPEDEIRRVIAVNAKSMAAYGEKDPARLLSRVMEAKRRGYSVRDLPQYEGIRAIGMPVLDIEGQPIAALSVSTLAARLSGHQLDERQRLVREHCEAITQLTARARL
jgi:DNA-binding IclR family transcriptional regulator